MNPGTGAGRLVLRVRNGFYPDTDDTAMVLMGLARSGQAWHQRSASRSARGQRRRHDPRRRARPQLAAAACRTRTAAGRRSIATSTTRSSPRSPSPTTTPCSTRAAPTSPPASSKRSASTASSVGHPQVDRGIAFIAKTQDKRGCWIGRWGVNYIYGTWQVLRRPRSRRLRHDAADGAARRRLAQAGAASRAAAGARPARATTTRRSPARGPSPPRRPPGPCSA